MSTRGLYAYTPVHSTFTFLTHNQALELSANRFYPTEALLGHAVACSLPCRCAFLLAKLDQCLLLLLLLQFRTQPHLGCCLAAVTAAASAIFMHLCTDSATPQTSRQHMRACNDINGNCANRRSRLTIAVTGHEKSKWASSSTGRVCNPKAAK
jgi:hypothetical protein